MERKPSSAVLRFCLWSAAFSLAFSIVYIFGQLADWLDILVFTKESEAASNAAGYMLLLLSSLFLGISFTILLISIHCYTSADKKIWSHMAFVFAVVYMVLISINYSIQLTILIPTLFSEETDENQLAFFFPLDSFLYSLNMLAYSFMSLSTFFVAFVFSGEQIERIVRGFLIANALVLPFIALQNYYPFLIWPALLWGITFPGSILSLLILFRRIASKNSQISIVDQIAAFH